VVLHELAHALTAPIEATSPEHAMQLVERVQATPLADPLKSARHHCPRWAAAYVVMLDRAMPFRRGFAARLQANVHGDLANYGHDLAHVRHVIGSTLRGELRPRLAVGTVWSVVLERAMPADADRVGAVGRTLASAGIVAPTGAAV
jgi:hypothetical protein